MPHPTRLWSTTFQATPVPSRTIRRFLLPTLLLTAAALAAGVWRVGYALDARTQPSLGAVPSATSPAAWDKRQMHAQQNGPLQSELITITPIGFDPAEVTRPAGRFILAVDNRSGLEEVTLVLRDEGGQELLRERVPRETLDWSSTVNLAPGSYLLSEADHPAWGCRLTLTNR